MNIRDYYKNLSPQVKEEIDRQLLAYWTYHSLGIEGNSFTFEQTLAVLSNGAMIEGKNFQEHSEIKGHANAIYKIKAVLSESNSIWEYDILELHKLAAPAVTDIYAPVGKYKVEPNGTWINKNGVSEFAYYPSSQNAARMMKDWVALCNSYMAYADFTEDEAAEIYADLSLKFTSIHPFADGNGRLARIAANIPLLQKGYPPIIIAKSNRQKYIDLSNKVSSPNEDYRFDDVFPAEPLQDFIAFCKQSWNDTYIMMQELTINYE